MSELQQPTSSKQNTYAALVLGGFVAIFGVITFLSLVWTTPILSVNSGGTPLRGIASLRPLPPVNREIAALRLSVENVDVGCVNKLERQPIQVFGKQIRIRGKLCGFPSDVRFVKVTNKKNGVLGTAFQLPGERLISTDYMSVTDGRNEFELEFLGDEPDSIKTATIFLERIHPL